MSLARLLLCGALYVVLAVPWRAGGAAAGDQICEPCGYGGGGRFTALAVDPRDPRIVLAGSDVAGVFKSTDGGDSFVLMGRGLESFSVAALAFHPDRPGHVYLLADSGLYHSDDGAESWCLISEAVRYTKRFFGSQLLTFYDNALWAGTDADGVFRISLATPATAAAAAPELVGVKVNCLALHRGMLHAATSRGMYRLDQGRWRPMAQGLPADVSDMTDMSAHAGGRLYAVEKKSGLYLYDDMAGAWTPVGHDGGADYPRRPGTFKALALHPANQDQLFLAAHPEAWPCLLLASINGGQTWHSAGEFSMAAGSPLSWRDPPDAVEAVHICPRMHGRMFLADWWNLWRSSDGGRHWQQLTLGLQNTVVNDVVQHPRDPETIFMAVADNGLVMSADGGRNWTRIMRGVENGHGIELALSRRDGRVMYFLLQPWVRQERVLVYKSTDGGDTWQDVGFSIAGMPLPDLPFVDGSATNLELDPHRDQVVYVGTNGFGVFKTIDGGRTWAPAATGLDTPYLLGPDALLAHPRQPGMLLAATQGGGIYRTVDGGQRWQKVGPGKAFVFGLAADPHNPARIIAGCAEKKLLLSSDSGMTWEERRLPGNRPGHIAAHAVAFDPAVPGRVFAGTRGYDYRAADGLYVSIDGGETFSGVVLDLPRVSINVLAATRGAQPRLLLGYNGIGLYCADFGP